MIIDSHQHFWKFDPVRDDWIDDTMGVICKDFLPKDLELILEKNGIDGCIAIQAETETGNFVFSDQVFTPFLDHVFSTFGPNRLPFGSDWPVCLLAADYSKVLAIIMGYLEQHKAESKEKILRKNAQLIYNL